MLTWGRRTAVAIYDQILARTRALGGVSAAGLTQDVPLIFGFRWTPLAVDGFDMSTDQPALSIRSLVVGH